MPKKKFHFILNPKSGATSFWDPVSKVKVVGKSSATYEGKDLPKRVKVALRHGHLLQVDEPVTEEDVKKQAEEVEAENVDLADLTKKELVDFYTSNFEVTKEDLANFKKMSQEDMVKFLQDDE